jgi:hypothetical protein
MQLIKKQYQMKTLAILLIAMITFKNSNGQIEIENKSQDSEINSLPYNGEFMSFENVYEKEKKAGVVGHLVTLLEVSTDNIYESMDALESGVSIDDDYEEIFSNKTYKVINYEYDFNDILKIKDSSRTYVWKIGVGDNYVFNKFISSIKNKYEGKTFVPLYKTSEFESMDGSEFVIKGNEKYTVNKVKFAKLDFEYGIVFNINNTFDCIFPHKNFSQPRVFNGEIYTTDQNYLNIASSDALNSKVTLIEENEYNIFSSRNNEYLEKIREKKVQIGMTEQQCRWAWGTPSKVMSDIAGYDKVLIWGEVGQSQNLYFKNGKLKLIK